MVGVLLFSFFYGVLGCCFGLLFWLDALACSSGVPSMAFFDAIPWHYESLC